MKKVICSLLFAMTIFGVSAANAAIFNVSCDTTYNRITFNHNSIYNSAWVYVDGQEVGHFWTISSGSSNFTTYLAPGEHVMVLWYNRSEGYGQAHADC